MRIMRISVGKNWNHAFSPQYHTAPNLGCDMALRFTIIQADFPIIPITSSAAREETHGASEHHPSCQAGSDSGRHSRPR